MDKEGIGSVFGAPFAVTLTMCVTVQANALKDERVRERIVQRIVRSNLHTGFVALVGDKDLKTQKTHLGGRLWIPRTFEGDVQGLWHYICRFSSSLLRGVLSK